MSPNVSTPPGKGTTRHKNARLTPKGREVLIQRLCRGQRPAEVARAMGISETTVRKWRRRHRGGEGLEDRCSRPRRSPRALSSARQRRIEALRRQRRDALGAWLHHHNWHRPHSALNGLPPVARLGLSRYNLLKLHS